MAEVARTAGQSQSRSRRIIDAVRGRDAASDSGADRAERTVSFAELVWVHYKRQEEVAAGVLNGPFEKRYRHDLKLFRAEHGDISDAYWCRHEASAVALTERRLARKLSNLYRRDSIIRLHAATDWRTEETPLVASELHRWETVAIRASEILRESTEKIVLRRIFAASTRLLALVDREPGDKPLAQATVDKVLSEQDGELAEVTDYYERAGDNTARIVYFRGMLLGTALIGSTVGAVVLLTWWRGWIDPHQERTYTLLLTIAMGALGAVLSVMTRMAKRDGFSLDFEVGRKSMRRLGLLRPWIGAIFALAVYLALKSSLVEFFQNVDHGIYYYATIGFLAGFSERWAKVLLDHSSDPPERGAQMSKGSGTAGTGASA
jgi:uncharacterized membrane protein YeaQ/YmgE (transglycosylase-associated protein family)